MHFRFKGLGVWVFFIVVSAFIVLRVLFEGLTTSNDSDATLKKHVNAAVLALSGMITFWIATRADRKGGIEVFSKRAWTTDLLTSEHIAFYLPMRLVGVLLVVASLFF